MRSPCCLGICLSVRVSPLIHFLIPEPIFMKLGRRYVLVYHASRAHLNGVLHKSHQSVCLYVYPPLSLLGNGSVNTFPRQRRIIRGVVFMPAPMCTFPLLLECSL
jgi:hypothetical protein